MAMVQDEIAKTVARLPEQKKREVLEFARRLVEPSTNRREQLRSLAGSISAEDGDTMLRAIEEGCERIDAKSW